MQVSARTEDELTRVKIWLRRIGEREEGVERGRKRGWKGEGEIGRASCRERVS